MHKPFNNSTTLVNGVEAYSVPGFSLRRPIHSLIFVCASVQQSTIVVQQSTIMHLLRTRSKIYLMFNIGISLKDATNIFQHAKQSNNCVTLNITDHLTLCMLSNFSCFCCHLLTFYKINFFKKFYRVSNGLYPDSVSSDLGPNSCKDIGRQQNCRYQGKSFILHII